MINSSVTNKQNRSIEGSMLEDIQYSLCNSYIKYASEKLAAREAQLMAQTTILLQKMESHANQKELTDLCTTEASLCNICPEDDKSSFNSYERKTTFKRKSKYTAQRNTKSSIGEAVQEIKEVCSQKTIALAQQIFTDYQKLSDQQHILDFRVEVLSRETKFSKNRDSCQTCQSKIQALQKRLVQNEEKIITLNIENGRLKLKAQQLQNQLKEKECKSQLKERECKSQLNSMMSNASSTYGELLTDKQKIVQSRCKQLKFIENNISVHLQSITQLQGCKRCAIMHQIKSQILQYRKHYEKEFQVLGRLLSKYRKIIK